MKIKKILGTLFLLLLAVVLVSCSKKTFEVVFYDWDKTVLDTQKVEEGSVATAPKNPTREGYDFLGWNKEYTNITKDIEIKSEEEIESDESEIKVIIYKNIYANRIEIEKEFEVNEYQYEYTIYEANKEVITIELEVEDDEMEFQIETDEDEHEYIIEKINNNQFKIIYDEEIIFYLTIDINNKTYTYNYNDKNIVK